MPRLSCLAAATALLVAAPSASAQTDTAAQAARVVRQVAALVREVAALRSGPDPVAPFRQLVGEWTGTLTYTDYGDDATREVLGVRIGVVERRDSLDTPALELYYAYTEPDGRAVEGGRDLLVPGTDPARFYFGDHPWTVVSRDTTGSALRLVIEREGDDNDRPSTIRETLTVGADGWGLLREVRYAGTEAFFERHTYALSRAE